MQNELGSSAGRIQFGDFVVDLRSQELLCRGKKLRLQQKSFLVLVALLRRPGQVVTREELVAALWPGDYHVDAEHGLNTAVRRLREALGDSAQEPRFVETLPKVGYRFLGDTTPASPPITAAEPPVAGDSGAPFEPTPALGAASASADPPAAPVPAGSRASAPAPAPPRSVRAGPIAVAVLCAAAAVLVVTIVGSPGPGGTATADAAEDPTAAAVEELLARSRYLRNHKRFSEGAALVRRALELDPGNPQALAGLSLALLSENEIEESRDAARRALELDPDAFEAHRALAVIARHTGDLVGVERHLRRAIEAPQDFKSRNRLARHLLEIGRSGEAKEHMTLTRRMAPDDPDVQNIWMELALRTGDYEDAIRQGELWTEIWEGRLGPGYGVRDMLGLAYVGARRHEEALAQFRVLDPDDRLREALALGYAGRAEEARAILEAEERQHAASGSPADPGRDGALAMAYLALGDFDRAFAMLDRQLAAGWYPGWLHCELFFGIRADPRWPAFAQRLERTYFAGVGSSRFVTPLHVSAVSFPRPGIAVSEATAPREEISTARR